MKWKLQEDQKGFTLMELLVSVAILAFVVAPFLGTFVTAGQSNVESHNKQEATDIGQLLAEEFKAKDFDLLKDEYNLQSTENDANGNPIYRVESVTNDIIKKYGSNYKINLTLKPAEVEANKEKITPIIDSAEGGDMAVFMTNFYRDDSDGIASGATNRKSTITIKYQNISTTGYIDMWVYTVELKVEYCDAGGNVKYVDPNPPQVLQYQTLPNIYLIYTPFTISDTDYSVEDDIIIIDNQLLKENVGDKKVKVYVAQQSVGANMIPEQVRIYQYPDHGGSFTLKNLNELHLQTNETIYETNTTSFFSNIAHDDTKKNLVHLETQPTLYNVVIDIYSGDEKVSTVTATKNIIG